MTRIDLYLLIAYFRTLLICFFSLSGVFVVIHAFNNLEELASLGGNNANPLAAIAGYYGPYLLALYDWTVDILAVMALLFTIGHFRRSGELTAILAAGIGHGRIVRPLLIASAVVILLAAINRETLLPKWRDSVGTRPQDLGGGIERALQPNLDRKSGILIGGKGLKIVRHEIVSPAFFLYGNLGNLGPQLTAETAVWLAATEKRPAGYLLKNVRIPEAIAELDSVKLEGKAVVFTPKDYPELKPNNCFVASEVPYELLQSGASSRSYLTWMDLLERVRNPSAHVPADLRVAVHSRPVRPFIDFAIVLASVSLAVGSKERNLFAVAGGALFLIIFGQLVKAISMAGGNAGYLFSPVMAAWFPLLIFGPWGYMRWREANRC